MPCSPSICPVRRASRHAVHLSFDICPVRRSKRHAGQLRSALAPQDGSATLEAMSDRRQASNSMDWPITQDDPPPDGGRRHGTERAPVGAGCRVVATKQDTAAVDAYRALDQLAARLTGISSKDNVADPRGQAGGYEAIAGYERRDHGPAADLDHVEPAAGGQQNAQHDEGADEDPPSHLRVSRGGRSRASSPDHRSTSTSRRWCRSWRAAPWPRRHRATA